MATKTIKPKANQPFETLVKELEQRVDMLEREDLDLTRAIEVFKEAVALAKAAQSKLDEAQHVVTKLLEQELKQPEKR
jgi:exodeoxyribonuclease VII small subunit